MANKEKLTPADYDRWGRTCVKFYEDTPQTAAELDGQPKKSTPEAATAEPKPPQNAKNLI